MQLVAEQQGWVAFVFIDNSGPRVHVRECTVIGQAQGMHVVRYSGGNIETVGGVVRLFTDEQAMRASLADEVQTFGARCSRLAEQLLGGVTVGNLHV